MKSRTLVFGLFVTFAAAILSAQGPTFTRDALSSGPVRLETTLGNIDIAVDLEHAPITSANFLRYVFTGYYDGAEFYRAARPDTYHAVLPNRPPMELIEARIPAGKPTYPPIPLERTSVTGLHHVTGTVAMGRNDDQPDSAASDFYILLNDQPSLDFGGKRFDDAQGTAAFGTVIAGMDVVRKINQQAVASRAATADNPLTKTQNLDPVVRITRAYRVQVDGPPHVVTLSGPALAAPRIARTDRDGKYQFTDVAAGTYTVTFQPSSPGFKKASRPNVVMRGTPVRADCLAEWGGSQ